MRTVYTRAAQGDAATARYVDELTAAGAEIRASSVDVPRLTLIDRRVAVLPVDPTNLNHGALFLTGSAVAPLRALFSFEWQRTQLFSPAPEDRPDQQHWDVLRLMAAGAKDETISRQLNLSVRTVRRCIAGLMTELGAESRFQAGLVAARRGWL